MTLFSASYSISWATGEPTEDQHCAVVRKRSKTSTPQLASADCAMQARYLCTLENDIACGKRERCFRSSVRHATLASAMDTCNVTSLHDADIGDATDLKDLAPGIYWVHLRRQSTWYWLSGKQSFLGALVLVFKSFVVVFKLPLRSSKLNHETRRRPKWLIV